MAVRLMTCPYCQTRFLPGENVQECPQCHTPHHENCWRENGGCTTFGCSGLLPGAVAPMPQPRNSAWADHIELSLDDLTHCAACGAELSVWDTICRNCHTSTSLPPSLTSPQAGTMPTGAPPYPGMPGQPYPTSNGCYSQPYAYPPPVKSPIAACLLNLLLLGAGYFYLNQVGKGILILLLGLVLGALSFGALTLVVLIYAMVDCYQSAEGMNRRVI